MVPSPDPTAVRRLTGVYHAEGSTMGEIRYVLGSLVGQAHCSLCDITHGRLREKRTWQQCRAGLPVPFDTVHLDERGTELQALTDGATPAVVAHTAGESLILLGPEDLERCAGDPRRLLDAVHQAMADRGLSFI